MRPWLFLLLLIPAISSAQTIYYCNVGGKQVISDRDCKELNGTETRRSEHNARILASSRPVPALAIPSSMYSRSSIFLFLSS